MNIVTVKNISKRYLLYRNPFEVLLNRIRPKTTVKEHIALRNVSFDIKPGETLGIVGHNGSGKSTLLQIITGVLSPSSGVVQVNGRVAALLELGSGFNPEFTGLENVYFNASIIGLKKKEIDERLDKILTFADIGSFINRPVKTYSSGMMVRLAFSVLINIDPNILIIDEALAVGDDAFQRKCFARLKELQDKKVTIILVSHSAGQVTSLCDRAILLDKGEILLDGNPRDVIKRYHKLLSLSSDARAEYRNELCKNGLNADRMCDNMGQVISHGSSRKKNTREGVPDSAFWYRDNGAKISEPKLLDENNSIVDVLFSNNYYKLCFFVEFKKSFEKVGFGMMLRTITGIDLGGATSSMDEKLQLPVVSPGDRYKVAIRFKCSLRNGSYFVNCGCVAFSKGNKEILSRGVDILNFVVVEESDIATGTIDIQPTFSIHKDNKHGS